ncbi:MAG: DUF488 domain-containing protein, partial [Gemmataceae bacterium]|nr:DUF488 domain-containing protein [Gemmataceae bacterium]
SAAHFFERLRAAGVRRLLDVRLHNTSTLAGFTKRDDLAYFLREIMAAEYVHLPLLAPTPEMLKAYQSKQVGWPEYEPEYAALLRERCAAETLDRALFTGPSVLLCSEATPERCHRRLVAEHLSAAWGGLEIVHL